MQRVVGAVVASCLVACTTVSTAKVRDRNTRDLFILSGDLKDPYESVGPLQVTHRGVLLLGFWEPAETDLQGGFEDFKTQARVMGGDGAINVRWEQTQYQLPTKIVFAVLFFIPLPAQVTVRGEVVRFRRPLPAPAPANPL